MDSGQVVFFLFFSSYYRFFQTYYRFFQHIIDLCKSLTMLVAISASVEATQSVFSGMLHVHRHVQRYMEGQNQKADNKADSADR